MEVFADFTSITKDGVDLVPEQEFRAFLAQIIHLIDLYKPATFDMAYAGVNGYYKFLVNEGLYADNAARMEHVWIVVNEVMGVDYFGYLTDIPAGDFQTVAFNTTWAAEFDV